MPYDPEVIAETALRLREQYPDDEEFDAAMHRLEAALEEEEDTPEPST